MAKDKLNIVYLGFSGFPYGLAEFQRILLISESLVNEGANVIVIGSRGIHPMELHPDLKKIGHFKRILYIYSSSTPFRSSTFLKRNIKKPFEKIWEFIVLYRVNKKKKIDAAIISTMNFSHLLFYKIVSRMFGFKLILNFAEYNSSMSGREGMIEKINDYFFDHYSVKISDGILVISEFLINVIKKINPNKQYLKIPVLVDFERYKGIKKNYKEKYFLYCGSALYYEIVLFIIKSFELVENANVKLYLVVNGNKEELNLIENRISISAKTSMIRLFGNLSDNELSELYINAVGLLIPLRPCIQDQARFPHKFGEYLASGNPVVTTNYGEVKFYFEDGVNALVADSYDEKTYAVKLDYVISNPADSSIIGENGKKLALEIADYKKAGERIISFINEIKSLTS